MARSLSASHRRVARALGAVALFGALAGLGGCQGEVVAAGQGPSPCPVLVMRVAFEDVVPERALVGAVRARVESDLGFRVPGKVAARLVGVGDAVLAGQPLAALDGADAALLVEQAEAERVAAATGAAGA